MSMIVKQLLFITLTWRMYTTSETMDGSGEWMSSGAVTVDQIDPGKHIM